MLFRITRMDLWILRLKRIPCAGIGFGILSGSIFAAGSLIVKLLPNINPVEIVISRSLIQALCFLPFVIWNRMEIFGAEGERIILFFRSLTSFGSFILIYISYRFISLADASTIVSATPVIVTIVAFFWLKEECNVFRSLMVALTIAGVVLIARPAFLFGGDSEDYMDNTTVTRTTIGIIIACCSCTCSAFNCIWIRMLPKTQPAVMISIFSIFSIIAGTLICLLFMLLGTDVVDDLANGFICPTGARDIVLLVMNGLCGIFGQLTLIIALKIEEAHLISLALEIDILCAFLFQNFFLPHESIQWTSIAGALLIGSSVAASAIMKWVHSRRSKV